MPARARPADRRNAGQSSPARAGSCAGSRSGGEGAWAWQIGQPGRSKTVSLYSHHIKPGSAHFAQRTCPGQAHPARKPPSVARQCPTTKAASSDISQTTAVAT
eukprot:149523_1